MTKTARDVVYKAMRRIGYISPEETPDNSDYAEALEEYQGFHNWLASEMPRLVHWDNDSVPDDYWTHVAGWFGGSLIDVLSVSPEKQAMAERGAAKSQRKLREMLARKPRKTVQMQIV